jgi:ComF family protein
MVFALRRSLDGVLSVLLAPRCLACNSPLDVPTAGPICGACWSSIRPLTPPLCAICGDALPTWRRSDCRMQICVRCRRRPSAISLARAAGTYEGALRRAIHALKYEGRRTLAARLGALMRARGAEVLAGASLVVPVPLHWRRQYARGFNQAEDLAAHLGLPISPALRRVRATRPQFGLPASQRHRNLRGAFAARRRPFAVWGRETARLRQACVVLVDDVSTTGATLQACAEVLLRNGAKEVRALTAARAVTLPR